MNKNIFFTATALVLLFAGCFNPLPVNNVAVTPAATAEAGDTSEASATVEAAAIEDKIPAAQVKNPEVKALNEALTEQEWINEDLNADPGGRFAPLAKCLTKKGVRMYGAYWCPHCNDQKEMFGGDFRFVNYFECDPKGENSQALRCTQDKITSYPTWYFPDSGYDPGTKPLEKIAGLAGCESYL